MLLNHPDCGMYEFCFHIIQHPTRCCSRNPQLLLEEALVIATETDIAEVTCRTLLDFLVGGSPCPVATVNEAKDIMDGSR